MSIPTFTFFEKLLLQTLLSDFLFFTDLENWIIAGTGEVEVVFHGINRRNIRKVKVVLVPFFPDFTGETTTGAASTYKQIKNKQKISKLAQTTTKP
jgi:hypothetical protein